MSSIMFLLCSSTPFASNTMHPIRLTVATIFIAMFWMLKFNMMPMMYVAMMGLVFLGGMSILVTYVSCICPNYVTNRSKLSVLLMPMLMVSTFKLDLMNNRLSMPYPTYFSYHKSPQWMTILCLFLLLMSIPTNYLGVGKGSFRGV